MEDDMTHITAHTYSRDNYSQIYESKKCGCFSCLAYFPPEKVTSWVVSPKEKTAVCPYCGLDAVIGDSSGVSLTPGLLLEMQQYWFLKYQ